MLDALRGPGRSPGRQDVGLIERAATDWLFSIENRRSGAVAQDGLGRGRGRGGERNTVMQLHSYTYVYIYIDR